jgi:putative toxin-antitoxin system antitoxin component (TIGR02293 family)
MSYIWRKEKQMKKVSKKKVVHTSHEDLPPVVSEAAVQYDTLRVILGGYKSVPGSLLNDMDLIDLSRHGVQKSTLKSLAHYLGITMEKMSSLLHTSHRNIQRKDEDELLDTLKTEKVLELAAFIKRGIDVTGSKDAFKEWLHSPIMALGNRKPIDFLDTTFGIQMALKVLGRLEQGVFS